MRRREFFASFGASMMLGAKDAVAAVQPGDNYITLPGGLFQACLGFPWMSAGEGWITKFTLLNQGPGQASFKAWPGRFSSHPQTGWWLSSALLGTGGGDFEILLPPGGSQVITVWGAAAGPPPSPAPGLASGPVDVSVTAPADRKSTRLNSSHSAKSRMPSSA